MVAPWIQRSLPMDLHELTFPQIQLYSCSLVFHFFSKPWAGFAPKVMKTFEMALTVWDSVNWKLEGFDLIRVLDKVLCGKSAGVASWAAQKSGLLVPGFELPTTGSAASPIFSDIWPKDKCDLTSSDWLWMSSDCCCVRLGNWLFVAIACSDKVLKDCVRRVSWVCKARVRVSANRACCWPCSCCCSYWRCINESISVSERDDRLSACWG